MDTLPVEIFLKIGDKLDTNDLVAYSLTSHDHNDLVKSIYKEYIMVTKKRDNIPILVIEKSHPKFMKIFNRLKKLDHRYDYYRFFTAYNENFIIKYRYNAAHRNDINGPRKWTKGEYLKYVASHTIASEKGHIICQTFESAVEIILKQIGEKVLDTLELNGVTTYNYDYSKIKQEIISDTFSRLNEDGKAAFNSGDYSFYYASIIKLDTSCDMVLHVEGHWNDILGKKCRPKFKKSEIYKIFNNGDRPFIVAYKKEKNMVKIYGHMFMDEDMTTEVWHKLYGKEKSYDTLIKKYKIKRFIPGVAEDSKDLGNSVLLDLGEGRYVFIRTNIYEFTTPQDEIMFCYSPFRASDVHYPVLVGEKYAYFMLHNEYVDKYEFPLNVNWMDAYDYFYGYRGQGRMKGKGQQFSDYKLIHLRE